MPESLQDLESRRTELVKQFARLGDLRSGSISNTSGRCGKPNCRCHRPGQPVHGPSPRFTYKVQGKTVTESLPSPAAKKAEHEIAEFRFEQLVREIHRSKYPDLPRPICGRKAGVPGKETTAACEKATSQLTQHFQRIFEGRHNSGRLDLDAVEMAIRSTVHQTGAEAVTELLRFPPPDEEHRIMPCACGQTARYEGMRSRLWWVGTNRTPLLSVLRMPAWTVSRRHPTGLSTNGFLSRCTADAGSGWQ